MSGSYTDTKIELTRSEKLRQWFIWRYKMLTMFLCKFGIHHWRTLEVNDLKMKRECWRCGKSTYYDKNTRAQNEALELSALRCEADGHTAMADNFRKMITPPRRGQYAND